MNPELQKKISKLTPRKIVAISLIGLILLSLAVTAQISYTLLKNDKIHKGVYVNDIPVGGLSSAELKSMLEDKFKTKLKTVEITLKSSDQSEKINFADSKVEFDIQGTVDKAFSIGRTGNIFDRLYSIAKTSRQPMKLELPVTYDKQAVENIVNSLYNKTLVPVKDADLLIQDDKVTMRSGRKGKNIDKSKTLSEVEARITGCKGETLELPLIEASPSRIDVEEYYKKISLEVKDATVKVENNKYSIVPHVVGRSIDKQALINIISELEKTENTDKILPVIFVKPKVTTDDVAARLFKDTLYSFSTQFYTGNTNDSNRGENIRIAVSKINGKILAPGETFSFNNVVGPRTEDGGYKVAHTYVGGKIVDGVGGGICQVSTTLYNAVLHSNLDIVERTNHMFTVGYVPYGQDAAVYYGQVDYKFKNSTNWPLKVEGWVSKDNKITFALRGTNETPGRTVEIYHRTTKTMDFSTVYTDDPALAVGTEQITSEGMKGYVIDTFKIIKQDGKVVSDNKIYTSVYKALDREAKRGTKKPQAVAPPLPQPTPAPGVDEAANPPATN